MIMIKAHKIFRIILITLLINIFLLCFVYIEAALNCEPSLQDGYDDLNALRAFRDLYLMKNSLGKKFVEAYYKCSPPLAEFIADKPALRGMVRLLFKPMVWMSKKVTK